jgi:hypothetical protein
MLKFRRSQHDKQTNKQPSLIDRCIQKIPSFLFVVKGNLFIKINETPLSLSTYALDELYLANYKGIRFETSSYS